MVAYLSRPGPPGRSREEFDLPSTLQGRIDAARRLAEAGRWPEAAAAYRELGDDAVARGDVGVAWQCASQEGDAHRRDDRPAAAARALRRSLDLMPSPAASAPAGLAGRRLLAQVELAGALLDAGMLAEAEETARSSVAGAIGDGARTVALDVLLSAMLPQGKVDECRGVLLELTARAPPEARAAVLFRQGLIHRLDGERDRAEASWLEVIETLGGASALAGPRAAAWGALAELSLLEEQGPAAVERFRRAESEWTVAGRRSGVFRAAAGGLRAALSSGAVPLGSALDAPMRYATERQQAFLEIELCLSRGQLRARRNQQGAEADLDRAVERAADIGALLLEGQARVVRRRCGFRWNDGARARACLRGDRVWSALVLAD